MLSDKQVVQLLAGQARCEQQNDKIDKRLETLEGQFDGLGKEVQRMSMSSQSLERSVLEILDGNKAAIAELGLDLEEVQYEVIGVEGDEDKPGLKRRTKTLETLQSEDNKTRKIAIILGTILLPVLGFFANTGWHAWVERGAVVHEMVVKTAAVEAALERHEGAVGHEGLRGQVGAIERSITAIDTSLTQIQRTQQQTRAENQTAHERLEQQVRRNR